MTTRSQFLKVECGGDRQRALTQVESLTDLESCSSCGRGASPAGVMTTRRGGFLGYADRNGKTSCYSCFLKAGGLPQGSGMQGAGPLDYQAIKDCIMETVNGGKPHEVVPKYAWKILKSKKRISVRSVAFIVDKACEPDNDV